MAERLLPAAPAQGETVTVSAAEWEAARFFILRARAHPTIRNCDTCRSMLAAFDAATRARGGRDG